MTLRDIVGVKVNFLIGNEVGEVEDMDKIWWVTLEVDR